MQGVFRQFVMFVGLILGFSVLAGALTWAFHPSMPAFSDGRLAENEVTLANLPGSEDAIIWVDARTEEEFESGHIPGAILVNEDEWERGLLRIFDVYTPDSLVVVYCDSETCHASKVVAARLASDLQSSNIYYLRGGWQSWQNRKTN